MFCVDNIKNKIADKKYVIGTHVKWSDSTPVEILARSGFDYIWFDGEHGAFTIDTMLNHVRAAQAHGTAAFYRVPWNIPWLVKPYLEIGVDGIIFPFVNSAELAEQAVASVLYPPDGIRGWAPGRINDYGLMPFDEYIERSKNIWKIIQIEHIEAVKHIDEILSVEGIDAIIVGMCDLSGSMDMLMQMQNPKLLDTLDYIAEKCGKAKIPYGISISYNEKIIRQWFKRGASLFTVGGDQDFVVEGSLHAIEGINTIAKNAKGE